MNRGAPFLMMSGSGAALGALCAAEFAAWLGNPGLLPSTPLELGVFGTVLLRLGLFLGIPWLRGMNLGNTIVLFSGDVLLFPFAMAGFLLTGDPGYTEFGKAFLSSWLSSGLIVYPALASFFVVRAMGRHSRLASVLPAAAGCLGVSSLALGTFAGGSGTGGLQGVAGLAFAGLKVPISPSPATYALLLLGGALLFASLAAYSITCPGRVGGRLAPRLALCVAGFLALIAWILVVPPVGAWATLGLPAAAIVGMVWVLTREE